MKITVCIMRNFESRPTICRMSVE